MSRLRIWKQHCIVLSAFLWLTTWFDVSIHAKCKYRGRLALVQLMQRLSQGLGIRAYQTNKNKGLGAQLVLRTPTGYCWNQAYNLYLPSVLIGLLANICQLYLFFFKKKLYFFFCCVHISSPYLFNHLFWIKKIQTRPLILFAYCLNSFNSFEANKFASFQTHYSYKSWRF
jgi:hypothetical protein